MRLGVVATTDFGEGWGAEYRGRRPADRLGRAPRGRPPDDARLASTWALTRASVGRVTVAGCPASRRSFPPGHRGARALRPTAGPCWPASSRRPPPRRWSWDLAPLDAERLELRITEFASSTSRVCSTPCSARSASTRRRSTPPRSTSRSPRPATTTPPARRRSTTCAWPRGLTEEGFDAAPRDVPGRRPRPSPDSASSAPWAACRAAKRSGCPWPPWTNAASAARPRPWSSPRPAPCPPARRAIRRRGDRRRETGLDFVELRWVAPADDGDDARTGAVAAYEIRWSDRPITSATWPEARRIDGPVPAAPGAVQTVPRGESARLASPPPAARRPRPRRPARVRGRTTSAPTRRRAPITRPRRGWAR